MTDVSSLWLIQQIQQHATANSVWFSDENFLHHLPDAHFWPVKPLLISNRWDLAESARQAGFAVEFTDFDVAHLADNSLDHIFYRISKEKAVTHHLINQAQRLLKPNGYLWLCGQKNEGVKTYIEKACLLLGCEKNIQKNNTNYSGRLTKIRCSGLRLNDENYSELRTCIRINDEYFASKPGQFGWNKIDQGSEFLIAAIYPQLSQSGRSFERCLDLGCGYGYLTLASKMLPIKQRTLTDNNAAALISASANCALLDNAQVIPSDAGADLRDKFDLILCNPPFHQGFSVDGDLTDKFLRNTQQLLTADGLAYFVVNQFIALEKKAVPYFKHIHLIAQNKSFNVFELRKK